MIWKCNKYNFDTRMPVIMGILNLTPDSFSDGGSYASNEEAIAHAKKMIEEGAQIIDVGGESTRPGATEVDAQEELDRVLSVVSSLASEGICVSIDTRHACVAKACVAAGASIINDISGFEDPEMLQVLADSNAGCVLMHCQGTPQTMQDNPVYVDVVAQVKDYLSQGAVRLEEAGVHSSRICLDPGPGFGKTASHTAQIMYNMHEFCRLPYPIMCAISRKSYLGAKYDIKEAKNRDEVSAAEALKAVSAGASVVRVHDVAQTAKSLKDLRPYCFLGLGSNVALIGEDDEETEAKIALLNQAISTLVTLPDTEIVDISSFYESEPAYLEDQDKFVNAVVLMRTGIAPKELLKYLHSVENQFGRIREVKNGPRTCDVDILDYQTYVCDTPELTLPHPLLLERDFVVSPLLELRPLHVLSNDKPVLADNASLGKARKID